MRGEKTEGDRETCKIIAFGEAVLKKGAH